MYIDKDLNVVDALAESHEISADAKTLTFHLRDAKYSNGDPIVAADLVYSWKRLVDPRTAAPYSYVMAEVAGAGDLLAMAGADPATPDAEVDAALEKLGVAAPDDKTFVVTLDTPATYFLSAMTLWVGVPIQEKWITSEGATEAANYVSSGPFVLDTWDHNSQIILKPNPNWYGDVKPTLTEIQMPMYAEPAAAQAAYETNEVDIIMPVASEDVPRVQEDPVMGAEFLTDPQLAITYYNFNNGNDPTGKKKLARCEDPKACPTANKNFRIALTQAIDKQSFLDTTFAGLGQVANSFVMPGLPGYSEAINPYPYDPDGGQGEHGQGAARARFRECCRDPAAQVRLQHRRRPRAASRLPGRGLADDASALRPSRSAASSASSSPSAPLVSTTSPATAGEPTTRTRTTSSMACSRAVAATTTSSGATRSSTACSRRRLWSRTRRSRPNCTCRPRRSWPTRPRRSSCCSRHGRPS